MSRAVEFLYGTKLGRALLCAVQKSRADRLAAAFLRSPLSRPFIRPYARRHGIPLENGEKFKTFNGFFTRQRPVSFDPDPKHLISPCDGYLSAYAIERDSSFAIKGSRYRLCDLVMDSDYLYKNFYDGTCLIFRLTPADYHHYCYIDSGYQGKNHYIPGTLHSVEPIACEKFPVYTMNRRLWTLLATENFGPVIQIEVGALVVGGIVNENENRRFSKGDEMGHFELAGSTIVLLFQKDRLSLLPEFGAEEEARVKQGMWIGNSGDGFH